MGATTNTRERIIEVAAALIDVHGESAVRIRELAEKVGITQPSLYHHFENRDAVVEAAQLYRFTTLQKSHLDNFVSSVGSCTSQTEFRKAFSDFFDFAHSDDSHHVREARISALASALRRPALMKSLDESLQELANSFGAMLTRAQERSWIRNDIEVRSFTYWLLGELTTLVFAESTGHKELRPAISQLIRDAAFTNMGLPLDAEL